MHSSNDLGLISLDMCVLQKIVPNCILTLHLPQCAPQLLLSRWPSGIQWGFLYALKAQCCLHPQSLCDNTLLLLLGFRLAAQRGLVRTEEQENINPFF